MRFKEFLLNENRAYLAQKAGDILTALQELRDDAPNMGTRDLTQYSMRIVNLIRRILHSNWPKEEQPTLLGLQKAAVAIMKSIDEKDDLPGTITAVVGLMEKLVGDLGVPINSLTPTETPPSQDAKTTAGSENTPPAPTNAKPPAPEGSPPVPQTMDQTPQATPPTGGTGQDMAAPPLGGSSGPLDAM